MINNWIVKAQDTPEKFIGSAVNVFDASNRHGKVPPFNYKTAIEQYRGWFYAATWMNAKAVATTPLRLYVRKAGATEKRLFKARLVKRFNPRQFRHMTGRGKRLPSDYVMRKTMEWGDEFEEVSDKHPLTELLTHPNPFMAGQEFACIRSLMTGLTGNFYMHPIVESLRLGKKDLSAITELWVMPSQYVKIQPGNDGNYIDGYWFGINEAQAKFYPLDEVFHMKRANPRSMIYGLGDVEAGWDVQQLSIMQRQTDMAHYQNHSRPDLAVVTKTMSGSQNIDKMKELQEEWARLFRGTFRQGSPVFLTGDTSVIPLNYQPTEIGDREIIVEEIAAITGVPVSLLKANDPNLASARVGFAFWRENTILPYCRMDEEYLNNNLLPAFGLEDDAFLCYDDPVPENRDEVQAEITVAMTYGTKTRNEVRVEMGDDPVDDENADILLVPAGLQPIGNVGKPPPVAPGMPGAGGEGGKEKPKENKRLSMLTLQSKSMYAHHKGDQANTVRDDESERLIRGMQSAIARIFAMQRRECMAALTQKSFDSGLLSRVVAAVFGTTAELSQSIAPFMNLILATGGKAGFSQLELPPETFDVTNPRVAEFMKQYTVKLAGEVNRYTAERLSETLAEGMQAGEAGASLSARVGELYEDFDGYRTEMIARTESARAYIAGTEAAWKESDVVQGKVWRLASGGCPVCSAIARKFNESNPVPLDEPFYPLGSVIAADDGTMFKVDYMPIMGPPSHPHCRCGVIPVMKVKSNG